MRHVLPTLAVCAAVALAATQEARAGQHDGRWALLQVTMTVAEVPMIGPMKTATTALTIHDLVHEGDRLHGKGTLCDITVIAERDLLTVTIPPKLRKVLPTPEIDARLAVVNGRTTFFHAPPAAVLGAKLMSPEDEALPLEKDHRVRDQDADGKPGVTVNVKGMAEGDMHVVQRSWVRLDGWLRDDGTFGGVARHGLAQSVISATAPLLWNPPANVPVIEGSTFRLGRLPAGACREAAKLASGWKG